jgi:predicted nucleic acid-binding Zn ribbon protein
MPRDLARELYRSFRTQPKRRKNIEVSDESRSKVNDPHSLADSLQELVANRDWRQGIAEGTLFSDWQKIVGDEIASHTTPISLVDGRLTIRTSSTAWATQLLLIQGDLLKTISSSAPGALVEEIAIFGPNAPSWKKGLRSVRGAKGPRDTFG